MHNANAKQEMWKGFWIVGYMEGEMKGSLIFEAQVYKYIIIIHFDMKCELFISVDIKKVWRIYDVHFHGQGWWVLELVHIYATKNVFITPFHLITSEGGTGFYVEHYTCLWLCRFKFGESFLRSLVMEYLNYPETVLVVQTGVVLTPDRDNLIQLMDIWASQV